MVVTLDLPEELAAKLQSKAEMAHLPPAELALNLLAEALETGGTEWADDLTLEELVAQIKATPPNPASIRPATGSLAEALQNAPHDPDFDLAAWTKEWAEIEAEMKAITHNSNGIIG
ncbi:MAG: hypothetical protein DPW09_08090 [Anaerolineae bacterium]|nr:hypothetical protein [Anaerolineae bacterium]